jgi:hypothetical protein
LKERRRTPETLGLELARLRVEHEIQANLISMMADMLYLRAEDRHALERLEAYTKELGEWAAEHGTDDGT